MIMCVIMKIQFVVSVMTNVLIIPLQMYVVIAPQLSEKFLSIKVRLDSITCMSDMRNQVISVMGFIILEPTALGRGWRISNSNEIGRAVARRQHSSGSKRRTPDSEARNSNYVN